LELIIKLWQIFKKISKFNKFESLFSWKILCINHSHIFQVKIWQNFAQKKNLVKVIKVTELIEMGSPHSNASPWEGNLGD
jgi:hypothetical protein